MKLTTTFAFILTYMALVLLKDSEESCQPFSRAVRPEYDRYQFIECKNLTLDKNTKSNVILNARRLIKHLTIVDSNITEINRNIFDGINLEILKIEAGVQIIQDRAFENCTISSVLLSNNEIEEIKECSFNTTSLLVVDLSNNSITEIAEKSFAGAFNLSRLDLHNNKLHYIAPYAFKDLQSLDELDLSHNQIHYLAPNIFRTVKYLRNLSLKNNLFKEFQADIFVENPLLEILDLQNNLLTSFDGRQLPGSLLQLDLENNTLASSNVSNLINLNILVLNYNNLSTINDCLLNLPRLNQLYLNHNLLGSSLNEKTFADLKNLSHLEADNNGISHVQFKIITKVKTLSALSLAENHLTFLDFTNITTKLRDLNFSSNAIEGVKNISSCSSLQTLELSNNNLDQIQFDTFSGLNQLRHLRLKNNFIRQIQKGAFKDLQLLFTLDLSYNRLDSIPNGILNGLSALVDLDLSHNPLTRLDEDVFHSLKSLRNLNIAFNNLTEINVNSILQHAIWLRQIDLNGNHWRCKDLIALLRDNKGIQLTRGTVFNVSNINGIPCNESEESTNNFNEIRYYQNVLTVLNNTLESSQDMSRKFTFLNVVLVLCAVFMIGKFIYEQNAEKIKVAGQFVYKKTPSEQDLQL